ncbi:MAG: hypothetical protein ACJ72G_07290 [Friedmanniella sp.]|jgi:hypothetical protein
MKAATPLVEGLFPGFETGVFRSCVASLRIPVLAAVAVAAIGCVAGCTPASEQSARQAAAEFQGALRAGDTGAACQLLSDKARSSLESTAVRPCRDALAALQLPTGNVGTGEVWGRNAQVALDSGVLFLAQFKVGWRVTAAGCTSRPEQPYDCDVEG